MSARHHWSVVSRLLAAIVGGYALTSLLTLAGPLLFSAANLSQAQALHAITMASFLVYAGIVIAVFHACSATRAWTWLTVAAAPPAIVIALLLPEASP